MPTRNSPRTKAIVTLALALAILVPSMIGFVDKFVEFIRTFGEERGGEFAITPIVNYSLATLGFLCMLVWATLNGMFRDIERPKFTMLETERMLDERSQQDAAKRETHS